MLHKIREKVKKDNGEIMIEATLIVVIVVYCIFFILDMGMLMYHQQMLTATANETAASVARTYHASDGKDSFYAIMQPKGFQTIKPYRHWTEGSMRNGVEMQGKLYAQYLLKKRVLPKIGEITEENVKVECKENDFGFPCIEVTLECPYEPLINLSGLLGGEDMEPQTIKAYGSAVCYDLINDLNEDALEYEMYAKVSDIFSDTTTAKIIGHVDKIVENIEKIMGVFN